MADIMATVLLAIIAITLVIRTVFYGISTILTVKANRITYKLANKFAKMYEPMFDYLEKLLDKLDI